MDNRWFTDLGVAYVLGIGAGAPVGLALVSMSGKESLMTVAILAAMLAVFVKKRADRLSAPSVRSR